MSICILDSLFGVVIVIPRNPAHAVSTCGENLKTSDDKFQLHFGQQNVVFIEKCL